MTSKMHERNDFFHTSSRALILREEACDQCRRVHRVIRVMRNPVRYVTV